MEGEYVVYLNAELQDINFEVTNELGTSKFLYRHRLNSSASKKLSSAGTNSTAVGLVVFFLILIFAVSLFIFKRRQRQKIFQKQDLVENQILEHLNDETSVSQSNLNEPCRCNQQESELPPPSYSALVLNENNETSDQVFVDNSSVQPSDLNSELKPDEELESEEKSVQPSDLNSELKLDEELETEEKRLSAYSIFLRSKSREDIGPKHRLTLFKSGDYDP